MMRGPPERAFLHRTASQPGHRELKCAAGFIGAMSEIAMITSGDAEHADEVANSTEHYAEKVYTRKKGSKTSQVKEDERAAPDK
jgi:hypothetical protein